MNVSPLGRAILETLEDFRSEAYFDQHGVITIGYGHTGPDVHEGMTCTQSQADTWLQHDLTIAEMVVNGRVTRPMRQHEFDALVLFTYNVGGGAFSHSTLLTLVNTTQPQAAEEFLIWNHVDGTVNAGLTKRRRLERALFLDGSPA